MIVAAAPAPPPTLATLWRRIVARSAPPNAAWSAESAADGMGDSAEVASRDSRYPSSPTVSAWVQLSLELKLAVPPNVYSRSDCVPDVTSRGSGRAPYWGVVPRHCSCPMGGPSRSPTFGG